MNKMMMQEIEKKPAENNKEDKFRLWKHCFKPMVYTFVFTMIMQIVVTFVSTYKKMWLSEGIPYDVKLEWILDNHIRSLRYGTFLAKSDGYIANLLQKIHLLVYKSAKSKIPDDDPFWIEFWQPASDVPIASQKKIEYSNQIAKEFLTNLKLISSNKSKVESFNNYHRYLFVKKLYYRVLAKFEFQNKDIKSFFESDILNVSRPIIEDFFNSKFDFYQYKNDISRSDVQVIPLDFISGILYVYMDLIMTDKKITCNTSLKELILDKSADYVFNDENLDSLRKKILKAYSVYNQQYEEYCRAKN